MVKIKNPLMSLKASGTVAKTLTFLRRKNVNLLEKKPEIPDARSLAQLSWRHMYQKAVALWHALSIAEKQAWESSARAKHMTGFAYFMSQCLRPNPGLYLPLQGGKMSGAIDMDGNEIEDLVDPTAAQDADTKAARDAAIAAAIGGSLTCDVYGYDGANWQKLLVESAAQHNLRVKLYDGANGIISAITNADLGNDKRGLIACASINCWNRSTGRIDNLYQQNPADNQSTYRSLFTIAQMMGFDGSTWDRIRTYGTGIQKMGRAPIGLQDTRMTATGQVGAAEGKSLYWISMNPSAANSLVELTDAAAGGAAVKWDMFHSSRMGHIVTFDPPLEFSTGIYVQTWTAMTSAIFGYL